jgi:hypothetical protein
MGVNAHTEHTGDEAMEAATGKHPDAWFALLDAQDATTWTHTAIAKWVHEVQGVPGWWAQSVTIRYEQARGMRLPGQRADGTFAITKSTRFAAEQGAVLDAAIAALVPALGAEPYAVSRDTAFQRARWRLDDGSLLIASADPSQNGKTPLVLSLEKVVDPLVAEGAKDRLAGYLAAVAV